MKQLSKILPLLIFSLLLVGCKGMQEPTEEIDTLTIGKMRLVLKNFGNIDGNHISGIQLQVKNTGTGEKYTMVSFIDGLFYSYRIPAGNYQVVRVYKIVHVGGYQEVWWDRKDEFFTVEKGKVNNLGLITFTADDNKRIAKFEYGGEYSSIKPLLAEKYPENGWLNQEWIIQEIEFTAQKE